jgi:hypothetical protein
MNDAQKKTHRELLGRQSCPSLVMKHLLTHSLDDLVHDGRSSPGDGYYWCARTCRAVGPDDEVVHPARCNAERGCFDGPRFEA